MPRRNKKIYNFNPAPEQVAHYRRNVLKIVRMVSEDDSSIINGALMDMMDDGIVPCFKKEVYRHPLFMLDPRTVSADLNRGFKLGFDAYRRKLDCAGRAWDDNVIAKIGSVVLRRTNHNGPKSMLFLPLVSEDLVNERIGYYEVLAENGVHGLEKKIKKPGNMELYLGQLDIPKIPKESRPVNEDPALEESIVEAITTSFSVHAVHEVHLGPSYLPGFRSSSDT